MSNTNFNIFSFFFYIIFFDEKPAFILTVYIFRFKRDDKIVSIKTVLEAKLTRHIRAKFIFYLKQFNPFDIFHKFLIRFSEI